MIDLVMFIDFFPLIVFSNISVSLWNQSGFLKPKIKTGFDLGPIA